MDEGLPFGSRGGLAVRHYFPLDGDYTLRLTLQRSDVTNGNIVRGLGIPNDIDVRLDRQRLHLFTVGGLGLRGLQEAQQQPGGGGYDPEKGLSVRFHVNAGVHTVGVTFNKDASHVEGVGVTRLPLMNRGYTLGRDTNDDYGRIEAGLDKIEISGPFSAEPSPENAIRKRVFICVPATERDEAPCAKRIVERLARLAYRRPLTAADTATLLDFYARGRQRGSFDAGIQNALTRMLVDVNFLFRREHDTSGPTGQPVLISDLELASRLAFFLWSSIPDDELLTIAARNGLREAGVLDHEIRRMLADERAQALVDGFFGQWLTIKNLDAAKPDAMVFPEFDDNLRSAFREETKRFLRSQLTENRPALELLTANYTFVNERLAHFYGIGGITGNAFRRVMLPDDKRGGLLGQGSVLTVTSYNDRTSVVLRGKWIMDTLLGLVPPPPPNPLPPPLSDTKIVGSLRQRMELHRKNPVCSACHNILDPLGFALENFDGIGKYRTEDAHAPVNASGTLSDGTKFDGPASFRQALLSHQDAFLGALTEKLLTYALGRGVEVYDMPAVRKIQRDAAGVDYRWSAIIVGIVKSTPFQMRGAAS
jgi:hypothetical protein